MVNRGADPNGSLWKRSEVSVGLRSTMEADSGFNTILFEQYLSHFGAIHFLALN